MGCQIGRVAKDGLAIFRLSFIDPSNALEYLPAFAKAVAESRAKPR
jgi:hypothetical protein